MGSNPAAASNFLLNELILKTRLRELSAILHRALFFRNFASRTFFFNTILHRALFFRNFALRAFLLAQ